MPKLAIILPTLNEAGNIAPLIERIDAALTPQLGQNGWEAIIVDDNSDDGTADEARTLALSDQRIRVLERFGRRGLASAAIEGMCATAAPYVAVMDADHQHDPALLNAMLSSVESGECGIAVASRFAEGASASGLSSKDREHGSYLANSLARRLTGIDLTDPMSGYFLTKSATIRALAPRLSGIGFKILLDILATSKPRLTVHEFPLQFAERREGESKLDRAIAFEFLVGLYERAFGRIIPTRYALFGTVGALGVGVHMAALSLLYLVLGSGFAPAVIIATFIAMCFNFMLNNGLTYADQRLRSPMAMLGGLAKFCLTCSVGALANVAVTLLLESYGVFWAIAALAGILIGSVWNYALSSRFVWGRFS